MQKKILLVAVALALLQNCTPPKNTSAQEQKPEPTQKSMDTHSFAQPDVAKVTHLDLDIAVNFDAKTIEGKAVYDIQKRADASEIIFDTDGNLEILRVSLDTAELATDFVLGDSVVHLGKPLKVTIGSATKKVNIYFRTSPQSAALQWLNPMQTAGKKLPLLFTQSQAILARTWLPCQDSPGIRFTYNATVKVPKNMLALMSAVNPQQKNEEGTYRFAQPKPIPAYLMALAVGDVAFVKIGDRTGVYAEPVTIKAAAYEFSDMEKMLLAAEKRYGSYAWGRYDLIVLPPSFPFGGMENPMLTFATPTILAGDRSLTSLVAHELAHSWSGNLVTNATWDDFWLNEGFTVYVERRIMEDVEGKDYAEMLAHLGYQDLIETIAEMGETSADTKLKLELTHRNPDDGVSDIAYEKGYFFLRLLEQTYGRPKFDEFLKNYFATNAFKSIDTEIFLKYLDKNLLQSDTTLAKTINITDWIYKPGLPKNCQKVQSVKFVAIDAQINKLKNAQISINEIQNKGWSTHEYLYFLRNFPTEITTETMQALDKKFGFTQSKNCEILAIWLNLAIKTKYKPADEALKNFLMQVGRRKFIKPLYQSLKTQNLSYAQEIYKKARPNYHAVSTVTLDEMLGFTQK